MSAMIEGKNLRLVRIASHSGERVPSSPCDRPLEACKLAVGEHASSHEKSPELAPLASAAAELLSMLRRRDSVLPSRIIGEGAWHILLAAYSSPNEIMQTKELCAASDVPEATAIRWLQILEREGFLSRAVHPIRQDQRATYYRMTLFGRANVGHALEAMLQR